MGEGGGDRIAWPARTTGKVCVVLETTQLTPNAAVVRELIRKFQTSEKPLIVSLMFSPYPEQFIALHSTRLSTATVNESVSKPVSKSVSVQLVQLASE
jgi:hypothetical protein